MTDIISWYMKLNEKTLPVKQNFLKVDLLKPCLKFDGCLPT